MCRADVHPDAETALVHLLSQIAARIAEEMGVPRDKVMIGPVDFGPAVGDD